MCTFKVFDSLLKEVFFGEPRKCLTRQTFYLVSLMLNVIHRIRRAGYTLLARRSFVRRKYLHAHTCMNPRSELLTHHHCFESLLGLSS